MLLKLFYIFLSGNGWWLQSLYYEVGDMVDKGSFNNFDNVMWTYPDASSKHGLFLSTSHYFFVIFQQTPLNFCTRSSVIRKHIPGSGL